MIRRATAEDAAAIAALCGQLGYPTSAEEGARRLQVLLSREEDAVFVADVDGAVVGWIHMFGCERLESEPSAEIGGFVVADGHRGSGIGMDLIAAGERWARERGYELVRVRSNVIRERAHHFYQERAGYQLSKRQAVFTKNLR